MTAKLGSVFIYGRFKDLSRDQVSASLIGRGGRLARSGSRADTVVVAHSAVDRCIVGSTFELPFETAPSAALFSEDTFRQDLVAKPCRTQARAPTRSVKSLGCLRCPSFGLPGSRTVRRHRRDLRILTRIRTLRQPSKSPGCFRTVSI